MYGGLTVVLSSAVVLLIAAGAGAVLTGSSFDTSNGNLTPSAPTLHDWNPAGKPTAALNPLGPVEPITCPILGAGTNCGVDWVGNSAPDNSFTQGTKEDSEDVVVATGSIPPNKDDLSRFYINKERRNFTGCAPGTASPNTCDYLYLAWERTAKLGSAHMDFEFNQEPVGNLITAGDVALNRTAGDLLVDFDFGGSGPVGLVLHRWIVGTNTPSADCEAVNSGTNVNCWGKGVDLTASGIAEGSVNSSPVNDYNPPVPAAGFNTLDGSTKAQGNTTTVSSTFGEAGINLTAANLFPPGSCFHLGDAWLKSRSSGGSFSSDMKDFIAPIPINISNCGEIVIQKHTDPRGINQNFSFNSTIAGSDLVNGTASGVTGATCREAVAGYTNPYTLNDDGNSAGGDSTGNTDDCANVPVGDYTVTGGADPTGFAFENLSCTATGTGTTVTFTPTGKPASIHIEPDGLVKCVYTNQQQLGALKITKTSSKGLHPGLAGAVFHITGPNSYATDVTTLAGGTICVDHLPFGTYSVQETSPPTGYVIDDPTAHDVVVGLNCDVRRRQRGDVHCHGHAEIRHPGSLPRRRFGGDVGNDLLRQHHGDL